MQTEPGGIVEAGCPGGIIWGGWIFAGEHTPHLHAWAIQGIQAEMAQERGRQTHIAFRSSYNLAYELVRPNDNLPTFVMDKDAYAVNNIFMEECMEAINIYLGLGKERSYGVRDEYRMSGMAMEEVLEDLPQRVIISVC